MTSPPSGWKLVPEAEFAALYKAARDLCERGPNERLREDLRSAGKTYEAALAADQEANAEAKGDFIAHAPADISALLQEVERWKQEYVDAVNAQTYVEAEVERVTRQSAALTSENAAMLDRLQSIADSRFTDDVAQAHYRCTLLAAEAIELAPLSASALSERERKVVEAARRRRDLDRASCMVGSRTPEFEQKMRESWHELDVAVSALFPEQAYEAKGSDRP